MKTMRYLLITFAVMMVMSVSAQSLAQQPVAEFHSTSSMVTSGSTLPQAAQSGVYTTYDVGLGTRNNKPGIRRDLDEGDEDKPKPGQPFPIGDGMWALMLLACGYGGFVLYRKRQQRNDRMMK